jgi:hypothetical protein
MQQNQPNRGGQRPPDSANGTGALAQSFFLVFLGVVFIALLGQILSESLSALMGTLDIALLIAFGILLVVFPAGCLLFAAWERRELGRQPQLTSQGQARPLARERATWLGLWAALLFFCSAASIADAYPLLVGLSAAVASGLVSVGLHDHRITPSLLLPRCGWVLLLYTLPAAGALLLEITSPYFSHPGLALHLRLSWPSLLAALVIGGAEAWLLRRVRRQD